MDLGSIKGMDVAKLARLAIPGMKNDILEIRPGKPVSRSSESTSQTNSHGSHVPHGKLLAQVLSGSHFDCPRMQ
jgi:hypothetical protein